jgi:hypothetical protein
MILEGMYVKKATFVAVLAGFFLCEFDVTAQQQSTPGQKEEAVTEQSKVAEDDKGVTKLPPLDEELKTSSSEPVKNEAAVTSAANLPLTNINVTPKQEPAVAQGAIAGQTPVDNPPVTAPAPDSSATNAKGSVIKQRERHRNVNGRAKQAENGEVTNQATGTAEGSAIKQRGRSKSVNGIDKRTTAVVNANGNVKKINNFADLEMDKWYFFASPATLQKIAQAQKDGNVPPVITDNAPVKNSAEPAPVAQQAPAPAQNTEKPAEENAAEPAPVTQQDSAPAQQNTEKPAEENAAEPAPIAQQDSAPVSENAAHKNAYADITIDTKGDKVNAVDDKGNKMQFPPTVTEDHMVLMNGDRSIAVINEDGTHIKSVPNNWEPGAPLNNSAKPEEKAASEQAPAVSEPAPQKEEQNPAEPETKVTPEPAPAVSEPITQKEEQKPAESEQVQKNAPEEAVEPKVEILKEPLDLTKGVPEGFMPKNAIGVILTR